MVSTGRLAQEKNWPTLLKAAAKVYQRYPTFRLVLIGDGPMMDKLQDLAAELGIVERVTFTGELPFSQVAVYLKAADLFGFASVTETQGLVTMEAMAAGLPVAAVNGSGTRDIVDNGQQGYLVANDADDLAASISRLIESPERMREFSARALEKARTFDVNHLAKKMVNVYEQAIQDKVDGQYVTIREEHRVKRKERLHGYSN